MRITSKGYKVPESGDRGTWFSAIEYDLDRVSAHRHDGVDSDQLTTKALQKLSVSVSHNDWVSVGNGTYKQEIDTPSSVTLPNSSISVHTSGAVIFPSLEIVSPTRLAIYVNDNSLDLTVYF